MSYKQHTGVAPPTFTTIAINRNVLDLVPGAVGAIAYGRVQMTSFLLPDHTFGSVGSREGAPPVTGSQDVYFNLYLPSGQKPANGWPVALLGPGQSQNKEQFPTLMASTFASAGVATLVINANGRGFGPLSTNIITRTDNSKVEFLSGGRGIDRNHDNVYEATEDAYVTMAGARDTTMQTVIDYIRMARAIEEGIDVDGDHSADLDAKQISWFGTSFGANFGVVAVALDSVFSAAAFTGFGGPLIENRRLSPTMSVQVGIQLRTRVPSLINVSGNVFNENFPLRNQPPVINTVQGAIAIQQYLDRREWANQIADSPAWASTLKARLGAKVLLNVAKGDQIVPNPAATRVIRAGGFEAQTTYYRHDLAVAANPLMQSDPHTYMTQLITNPHFVAVASGAQSQAAFFLATGGMVIHPAPQQFFEVPIVLPLPETLNFIP